MNGEEEETGRLHMVIKHQEIRKARIVKLLQMIDIVLSIAELTKNLVIKVL
jgi:hypothetical protein